MGKHVCVQVWTEVCKEAAGVVLRFFGIPILVTRLRITQLFKMFRGWSVLCFVLDIVDLPVESPC